MGLTRRLRVDAEMDGSARCYVLVDPELKSSYRCDCLWRSHIEALGRWWLHLGTRWCGSKSFFRLPEDDDDQRGELPLSWRSIRERYHLRKMVRALTSQLRSTVNTLLTPTKCFPRSHSSHRQTTTMHHDAPRCECSIENTALQRVLNFGFALLHTQIQQVRSGPDPDQPNGSNGSCPPSYTTHQHTHHLQTRYASKPPRTTNATSPGFHAVPSLQSTRAIAAGCVTVQVCCFLTRSPRLGQLPHARCWLPAPGPRLPDYHMVIW